MPVAVENVDAPLSRRLAVVSVGRLVLISVSLGLVAFMYLRRADPEQGSFTVQVALWTAVVGGALTALYGVLVRRGRRLPELAAVQLVVDQMLWSVLVYLTGGASSGATSLYGITCVAGGLLLGLPGAATAALAAGVFFSLVVLLLQAGGLPIPPDQSARVYELTASETAYYLVVNFLVLVVVTLLVGYLSERLRHAGGKLEEARLRADQAERMASMGRLAAGLAHEIRNPLSSISGSIQLLKAGQSLGGEDRELCDIVLREAGRLNDLVSDMLDLARPRKPQLAEVDLSRVAQEVVQLASKSGRAASDVSVKYVGPDSVIVRADGQQLRQLIWNLVRNGVQASSAGEEVRVVVRCDEHVSLAIEDDGVGIDRETLDRLFDAFFTTRSKGTGVGLAVVKRIADEHRFAISVDTERQRGATFRLDLGPPLEHPSLRMQARWGA